MPPELLVSIEDDIVGVETQDAIDIVTVTGLGVGDLQLADHPPQLSPTGRPEALAPGNPGGLSLTHPQPPVQPAPSRATPSRAPLQQAAAACWGRRPRRARAAAAGAGGPEASGCSGGGKCLLNFLLCCRCCQALLPIFSSPHSLGAGFPRPDWSGGFLWRPDLASPTTLPRIQPT